MTAGAHTKIVVLPEDQYTRAHVFRQIRHLRPYPFVRAIVTIAVAASVLILIPCVFFQQQTVIRRPPADFQPEAANGPIWPQLVRGASNDAKVLGEALHTLRSHTFWIGTRPLRAVHIAALDALTRYRPRAPHFVHITVEEGIPQDVLETRLAHVRQQLHPFRQFPIQLRVHDDVRKLIAGTPMALLPWAQHHIGGKWDTPWHPYFGPHASDFLKVVVGYKEGGILMDDDAIFMQDLTPVLQMYGTAILVPDDSEPLKECEHTLASGFFVMPAGHPFLLAYVNLLYSKFVAEGLDYYFPSANASRFAPWGSTGPQTVNDVHRRMCAASAYPSPLLVNQVTPEIDLFLKTGLRQQRPHWAPPPQQLRTATHSYAVVSDRYFTPAQWTKKDFLLTRHGDPKLVSRVVRVLGAFQFHIFGKPKWTYLDIIQKKDLYPIAQVVHMRSCNVFCDMNAWKTLLPPFPDYRDQLG